LPASRRRRSAEGAAEREEMASSVRGGGDAGEGEWLKVAELKAMAGAQDPHAKVRSSSIHSSSSSCRHSSVMFFLWVDAIHTLDGLLISRR
jgi:hypothetical protein